ncbi:MAG: histidine phosphatase family protein [Alphaproteobacteria bacterium]
MAPRPLSNCPIYFARHGETEFNVERRWQGSSNDSPLTARGVEQARQTGKILRGVIDLENPPLFVSSPLGRARATTEHALESLGLPRDNYTLDTRLVEIDLGEWTGTLADHVKLHDRERWDARQRDQWNIPCPGGESFSMAAERAIDWIESVDRETVALSHGVFGKVLRATYIDLPAAEISGLLGPHGSVFRLHGGAITCFDLRENHAQ